MGYIFRDFSTHSQASSDTTSRKSRNRSFHNFQSSHINPSTNYANNRSLKVPYSYKFTHGDHPRPTRWPQLGENRGENEVENDEWTDIDDIALSADVSELSCTGERVDLTLNDSE
jgi:hypothetical protein